LKVPIARAIVRFDLSSTPEHLRPQAALVLSNLGGVPLYHATRGQRHPLGIFNVTFAEVVRSMRTVLDELDAIENRASYATPANYSWAARLLDATDHLLDSIIQHLDSHAAIVETLFEDKHCQDAKKAIQSIRRATRRYRDHVAKIVNAIKHNQRKLSAILIHDVGLCIPGYFVEGVCKGGAIGPDPDIHDDSNVAISFNRDLPFHMINLYHAAATLASVVQKVTGAAITTADTSLNKSDEEIADVMRRLSLRPRLFYPDEATKPLPLVEYRREIGTEDFRIRLEMPGRGASVLSLPRKYYLKVQWSGDGVSRRFKYPYWSRRKT
jgi:hypothetical protein